jgi:hypothetical protein
MDFGRYEREQEAADVSNYQDSLARTKPVTFDKVKKLNPVSILEKYLLLWPPCDVRCEMSYQATHEFDFTDSAFMDDLADGMILQVMGRDPMHNAIILGVYLQSNLAEFERYNLVVEKHNDTWIKQGCPEDVFNPLTGDISEIKEKLVSYADTESPYFKRPKRIKNNGPLERAKPNAKRNLYSQIEFRLDPKTDKSFTLSFVAKDYNGQIIYYNVLTHKDIAYLTRRAIQELFGNPFVYGNKGPLLDGISLLIQGKKLEICDKEHNKRPDWMVGPYKVNNPRLTVARIGSVWYNILGCLFGILIPIVIFWNGVLVASYRSYMGFVDTMHGDHSWFVKVIGSCVLIIVSFLIAKYCFRKSNVSKLQSNLL